MHCALACPSLKVLKNESNFFQFFFLQKMKMTILHCILYMNYIYIHLFYSKLGCEKSMKKSSSLYFQRYFYCWQLLRVVFVIVAENIQWDIKRRTESHQVDSHIKFIKAVLHCQMWLVLFYDNNIMAYFFNLHNMPKLL